MNDFDPIIEITRSFTHKVSRSRHLQPYESADFFCSRKGAVNLSRAGSFSEELFHACVADVARAMEHFEKFGTAPPEPQSVPQVATPISRAPNIVGTFTGSTDSNIGKADTGVPANVKRARGRPRTKNAAPPEPLPPEFQAPDPPPAESPYQATDADLPAFLKPDYFDRSDSPGTPASVSPGDKIVVQIEVLDPATRATRLVEHLKTILLTNEFSIKDKILYPFLRALWDVHALPKIQDQPQKYAEALDKMEPVVFGDQYVDLVADPVGTGRTLRGNMQDHLSEEPIP